LYTLSLHALATLPYYYNIINLRS